MRVFVGGKRVFDHMMVSEFCRCPNRYFFKHVLGLSSPAYAEALHFGIMVHAALAVWMKTGNLEDTLKAFLQAEQEERYVENTMDFQGKTSARTVENGLEKIKLYCSIFAHDGFKTDAVEVEHFVPVIAEYDTANFVRKGRCGHTVGIDTYYVVHVDTLGSLGLNPYFMEHKTTTLYAGSPSLEAYTFGLQVMGYSMAMQHKLNLDRPCPGLLDFIYLRSKQREDCTARFPLEFSNAQMASFRSRLSKVLGSMLCWEQALGPWTVPTNERCCAWNSVCGYSQACGLLPDVKSAADLLQTLNFIPTPHSRIETLACIDAVKQPKSGELYYRVEDPFKELR